VAQTLQEVGIKVRVRIEKGISFAEILQVEGEEEVLRIIIRSRARVMLQICSWVPYRKK
jgi:hypothetical protein